MREKTKHYPDVDPNPDFPKIEEKVLAYWKESDAFQQSVDNRPALKDGKNNEFIFYDGPPFANGLPHYGHLLTGYVKDLYARYQTMKGRRVERRFGWDCHGLPAEMGAEKELGISGRAAISNYGIGKFNEHCRTSVMKYTHEWEYYVNRQARWVDFKNDYKTMDKNFMESVLWAFKQLWDKGLIYEAHRVMPYSWAAETPLSNFETKLDNSYRERTDKAITVAFELNTPPKGAPKADKYYILAWTTTPWTLPSNLALAVNKEMEYATVVKDGRCYILSFSAAQKYFPEAFSAEKIVEGDNRSVEERRLERTGFSRGSELSGQELLDLNLSYHPLFPYFANHKHSFKILDGSSFVSEGDGTGVVHMAPGFGEDDQKCCEANGIDLVVPVDGQGKFTDAIFDIPYPSSSCGLTAGSKKADTRVDPAVKPQDDGVLKLKGLNVIEEPGGSQFGLANDRIIDYLKTTGQLIKQEQIVHNYPHCWRTDKPLIYRALPSWYVEVTKFRDRAVELNRQINWIPDHIRDGQMGHMLATAPDWSISRNRFWGTPIPVWRRESSESGVQSSEMKAFGSIKELEEFFVIPENMYTDANQPNSITDLHRPFIDKLTTAKDGSKWQRVEDVFDCWFESGSMPFAQVHYPFENKDWFEKHFPADFITEYVGQTRGWFNTLIMLSTALFDKPPFKNCICHGVVLDAETGLKYSKRLKNYKDPKEVMDQFGADALRWLMMASPVMRGADLAVDPEGKFIRDVVRLAIKPIWNAYNFFTLYANADGVKAKMLSTESGAHLMDAYILQKCDSSIRAIDIALETYDTPSATDAISRFFDVLNNWYIRRSKERFWKESLDADKQSAYDTLYTVLYHLSRAAAPLLPFALEAIFQGLNGNTQYKREHSVHLAEFPKLPARKVAQSGGKQVPLDELERLMDQVRDACNAALSVRNAKNIRVRQPLKSLTIVGRNADALKTLPELVDLIKDEVNAHEIQWVEKIAEFATYKLALNNPVLGKRLPEKMKQIIPASKKGEWKRLDNGSVEICGEVLKEGEYTLNLEPKPEYKDKAQPLSTNDALVILDTTITPELEMEGLSRDLIRMIQQARKDSGLNVSDRIELSLELPQKLAAAAAAHEKTIAEQTLALKMNLGSTSGSKHRIETTLDDDKVVIGLSVAA